MSNRRQLANCIRALSMDAVQRANSGHPGMPLGMADIAEVLWNDFLVHNPQNPGWANRDRFLLSNGHGCMLLYSVLHLTGYDLSIAEIKNFRQLHSKTPGHPEYGDTPGVETTTGPLGQGLANAVGMAIAEKTLAAQFNQDEHAIIDHHTYVFAGDGCLMEGISHEVCSLAGTLALGKLILFYDDNGISIDGKVGGWFTDDTPKRFEAYGWHVIPAVDGHDSEAVRQAIEAARAETTKATIICCRTEIGHGAPNLAGSHKTHGAPLGDEEIAATRENIGWSAAPFEIPDDLRAGWDAQEKGAQVEKEWNERFKAYGKAHPTLAAELQRRLKGELPANWQQAASEFIAASQTKSEAIATRKASKNSLESFGPVLPELFGGSADLTGSNLTWWSGSQEIRPTDASGNYIHFGVREFGMFAIMNGMALHGGFIPYGGTFLTFVDYGRNAVRLAALMQAKSIFVLSHDSIGLGEDGPTHQPIEHAAMLRLTPGLRVWRPCDTTETAVAWQDAIEHAGPTCLLLSRQSVPHHARDEKAVGNIARGGYVLRDTTAVPDVILIATGSEVSIAMSAAEKLTEKGHQVRVVSMPCTEVFDAQPEKYRESVLPQQITARVVIEAGVTGGWYRYVGSFGAVVGIDRFGASAPAKDVYQDVGLTVETVILAAQNVMQSKVVA